MKFQRCLALCILAGLLGAFFPARLLGGSARERFLRVCDDVADPSTLDPQREFAEKNHTIIQQIFEGLVRFGPEGQIEPALAESWKRLDDRTIQFNLRRGVYFQNGEPFDATSVKFSIERYLDPRTQFPALGYINSLERVDIVDAQTVRIVTKYSDGLLLNRLAGFIVMVPPRYYGESSAEILSQRPFGTGPFVFDHWEKGSKIVLSANKKYWDSESPKLGELVFRFIPSDRQVEALLGGEIDLLTDLPGTRTLEVQRNPRLQVVKSLTLYTVAGSFNLANPMLRNIRIRKALNYAINKDELVRYDLLGNGRAISSLVLQGYPEADRPDELENYAYNPGLARAFLGRGKARKAFKLRILDIKATRAARIIASAWNRMGIKTEVYSTTDSKMIEDLRRKPGWDVMIGACPDPMYHPYFLESIFLYSKSPFSLTHDERVDALTEAIVAAVDSGEQSKKVKELGQLINREALTLFTYQRIRTYGLRKDIVFHPALSGMPYFRNTYFQEP